ncbi:MAG TPA: hypothetical protein PLO37_01890 [Candidatus Hydrogenedentes bacterium]|nr:hypothetical protein [Candidatus Hydrogenedentota bacterium]HPG65568.1 hypothetical protein [Candidatus Hydrogenedentota bacterium]
MQNACHERLVWNAIFHGEGLQLLDVFGGDPDIDAPVFAQGVSRVSPVLGHLASSVLGRLPPTALKRFKQFLFFVIQVRLFHFSLPGNPVLLSGSG